MTKENNLRIVIILKVFQYIRVFAEGAIRLSTIYPDSPNPNEPQPSNGLAA